MKKSLVITLALAMILCFFAGCGNSEPSETAAASATPSEEAEASADNSDLEHVTIAYCTEILDENETGYANAIQYGIDQYNASPNPEYYIEKLVIYDANSSVDTQNSQLEDCVSAGVDVVILTCVDDVGNRTGAQYCIDHGVKVIDVRGGLYDIADCVCCPCNFASEAAKMHAWWNDWLTQNPDEKLNIGVVFATAESTASFCRVDWVYDFQDEHPDNVNVEVKGYGDWATEPTQKLVEDWIQTYPDINLIVCANDEEALGAVNALTAANKLQDVMVTGVNGGTSGTSMLKAKQMTVTVGQLKDQAGLAYLEVALKVYKGEKVEYDQSGNVTNYDQDYEFLRVITPDNIDDWVNYKSAYAWW